MYYFHCWFIVLMEKVKFEECFFNIIFYAYIFFYFQFLLDFGQAKIQDLLINYSDSDSASSC